MIQFWYGSFACLIVKLKYKKPSPQSFTMPTFDVKLFLLMTLNLSRTKTNTVLKRHLMQG